MDKVLVEKAKKFKILNEMAVKNETAIFGSDFLCDFPFYDLMQGMVSDYVVYNRSIEGLKVADAIGVVEDCLKYLQPKNILVSFGENEENDEKFYKDFNDLIVKIKTLYRKSRVCILQTPNKPAAYHDRIKEIAAKNKAEFMCFDKCDDNEKKEFFRLSSFFRNGNISFSDVFAV